MNQEKEVFYDKYCKTCKHGDKKDYENPCNDCLNQPANVDSHKPVYYINKENEK